MKTKKQKLQERVEAGAAFLNVVRLGWWKEINIKRLNLSLPNVCMLGELYGDYYEGALELGFDSESQTASALGFRSEVDSHYPLLTELWKKKIKSLRL